MRLGMARLWMTRCVCDRRTGLERPQSFLGMVGVMAQCAGSGLGEMAARRAAITLASGGEGFAHGTRSERAMGNALYRVANRSLPVSRRGLRSIKQRRTKAHEKLGEKRARTWARGCSFTAPVRRDGALGLDRLPPKSLQAWARLPRAFLAIRCEIGSFLIPVFS